MRITDDIKLDFDDVLMTPKQSFLESRAEVDLERSFTCLHAKREVCCVPIIAANMAAVSGYRMVEALADNRMFTALPKDTDYWHDDNDRDWSFMTIGSDLELIRDQNQKPDKLCIDIANGYMNKFVSVVKEAREMLPEAIIIAGNVCTPEATERLIFAGADIVKIGIGGGSGCTTRIKTGVGYPQLSAVIECADSAHGLGGMVMSDGGCRTPADVCKAFGAGADFVMLGGMLSGHKESPGEIIDTPNGFYKEFYGMSSHLAQDRHSGGIRDYRSSEGREVLVPYRGTVQDTINDILGGLRSCCAYCGASRLKELSKRTTFVRVSRQLNTVFAGNPDINQ
jgi:GMP reductase